MKPVSSCDLTSQWETETVHLYSAIQLSENIVHEEMTDSISLKKKKLQLFIQYACQEYCNAAIEAYLLFRNDISEMYEENK